MHEATIAQLILLRSIEIASIKNEPIVSIRIRVGRFRNVDPESLLFAFQSLKREYDPTTNAELSIESVSALARCSIGGHQYHPSADDYYCCTICGGGIGELLNGKELEIIAVETTINDNSNEVAINA